tara:strand:+ start:4419 stop:4808 length:390 start_codon:yes stop_codon:yes gene_type:complete
MSVFTGPKPGVGSVGQYQMSAQPYATSSLAISNTAVTEIVFPQVTKFVTITNTNAGASSPLRVGFSSNGVIGMSEKAYFTLDNGESYTGEWRLTSLFLSGDSAPTSGSVIAGVTGIQTTLNYTGSAGVG